MIFFLSLEINEMVMSPGVKHELRSQVVAYALLYFY